MLLGRNPGPIQRGRTIQTLGAPPVPPGVPSQLLERRPGILQAEQQLFPAELGLAATQAAERSALVSIYQAMGGGWVDEAAAIAPVPVRGKGPFAPAIPRAPGA